MQWVRFTTFTEKGASVPKQLLQDLDGSGAISYVTQGFGQVRPRKLSTNLHLLLFAAVAVSGDYYY